MSSLVVNKKYLNSYFIDYENLKLDYNSTICSYSRRQVEAAIGCKIEHYVREKLRQVLVDEYDLKDDVYRESQECLERYFVPGFANAKNAFLNYVYQSRARRLVLETFQNYPDKNELLDYFYTEIKDCGTNQALTTTLRHQSL